MMNVIQRGIKNLIESEIKFQNENIKVYSTTLNVNTLEEMEKIFKCDLFLNWKNNIEKQIRNEFGKDKRVISETDNDTQLIPLVIHKKGVKYKKQKFTQYMKNK